MYFCNMSLLLPERCRSVACYFKPLVLCLDQIERAAFDNTMIELNRMYDEAEKLGGRTYCESCFACLTAYLSYLCMDTYYEKVRMITFSYDCTKVLSLYIIIGIAQALN